jgi:hypothetical protein
MYELAAVTEEQAIIVSVSQHSFLHLPLLNQLH